MGSLKLEQRQKVESDQEKGREVQESGEQKLEEAEASQGAMEQIEAIDDDDKAALDAARSESDGIAKAIAESEVKEPGREVGESLKETSEQSTEYSETEMADAEKHLKWSETILRLEVNYLANFRKADRNSRKLQRKAIR